MCSINTKAVFSNIKISPVYCDEIEYTQGGNKVSALSDLIISENKIVNLPTTENISRKGYKFAGWVDSKGNAITNGTEIDDDICLFSKWTDNSASYIPGDINGDGIVNNKDLTRLMKYHAGEDVTVVTEALDVNGDGNLNNKDLTRLMKYLAGDNVEIH